MLITGRGNNICNILAEARRVAGLQLNGSRETLRSGGDDGMWRVHLADGTVVEATVVRGTTCEAHVLEE